jgi:Rap1a immunity proteins
MGKGVSVAPIGAADVLSAFGKFCAPAGGSPIQVRDIVVNYLVAHPELRQYAAPWLIQQALSAVWPCH